MPYNAAAVEWSAEHFDRTYQASWFPVEKPTLVLSGAEDRIVVQRLWDDPAYRNANVRHAVIEQAGHWPWLDQPEAVTACLADFLN